MKDSINKLDRPSEKLHQSAVRLEEMLKDPEIPQEEIANYYSSNTLVLLKEMLNHFHNAVNEKLETFNK